MLLRVRWRGHQLDKDNNKGVSPGARDHSAWRGEPTRGAASAPFPYYYDIMTIIKKYKQTIPTNHNCPVNLPLPGNLGRRQPQPAGVAGCGARPASSASVLPNHIRAAPAHVTAPHSVPPAHLVKVLEALEHGGIQQLRDLATGACGGGGRGRVGKHARAGGEPGG